MAQIKIYGRRELLAASRAEISASVHAAAVDALGLPEGKRFHRFLPLDAADFVYPDDRSANYLIIEISMFAGRTVETRKSLIRGIYARLADDPGLDAADVEITIFESPRENWGIRGMPGDELALDYQVTV